MDRPKILNLLVGHDDGTVGTYYGIHHEGSLWLVTAWVVSRGEQVATPERMIQLDTSRAMRGDPGDEFDYANLQLPRAVLSVQAPATPELEARNFPASPQVDPRDLKPLPRLF